MANVYERERTLERDISGKVEEALPGVEVLAVELNGPERFTVFVDRPDGVDIALCERVTRVLQDYLRTYAVDVSSPGPERPLTKPDHYRRFVGRRARVRTREDVGGSRSFTGELVGASDDEVTLAAPDGIVAIPYTDIQRSHLVEE